MKLFGNCYRGTRVLITGHTGFKGSWLTLWLKELGAEITGVALQGQMQPNHWDLLSLVINDVRLDIRDEMSISRVINETQPEIVFHLAAQPLVRRSYREPLETWSTNVMGTANILEACRNTSSVRAIIIVTTDKCYINRDWDWGYRENDRLGGYDPYSASKASSELVAASYRDAYFKKKNGKRNSPQLATARAGNVIGGGDWSEDRLIPDIVRSIQCAETLGIRMPQATRPWQHVLEPLSGYLLLGERLLGGDESCAEAWNFGPDMDGNRRVVDVLGGLANHWQNLRWRDNSYAAQEHEARLLYLDSSKARSRLGWNPIWKFERTLEYTAKWYKIWMELQLQPKGDFMSLQNTMKKLSRKQLNDYQKALERKQASNEMKICSGVEKK